MTIAILLIALVVILVGAETFTNALEHLGERLKISEGVTGSIFAAVGTALPETMVPVVAILSTAGTQQVREEVGVGAILGAPLMLSTLTLFLMAAFAAHKRGWGGHFHPERSGVQRDLLWFLIAFGLGAVAIFVPHEFGGVRALIALSLVVTYFVYLMLTIRASSKLVADGHATEADNPLFLVRLFSRLGLREGHGGRGAATRRWAWADHRRRARFRPRRRAAVGHARCVGIGVVIADYSGSDRVAGKDQQHSLDPAWS